MQPACDIASARLARLRASAYPIAMAWPSTSSRATRDAEEIARACPACNRSCGHVLRFRRNGCDILQCKSCGLGRAEASNFNPETYYNAEYFSGGHTDGYTD